MFENKTRVLLILPADVLERARVLAGRTTTKLKLTVSLQIVLRALIEEGLKRADDRALLANIENQAHAVLSLSRRRCAVIRLDRSPGGGCAGSDRRDRHVRLPSPGPRPSGPPGPPGRGAALSSGALADDGYAPAGVGGRPSEASHL